VYYYYYYYYYYFYYTHFYTAVGRTNFSGDE